MNNSVAILLIALIVFSINSMLSLLETFSHEESYLELQTELISYFSLDNYNNTSPTSFNSHNYHHSQHKQHANASH